MRTTNVKQRALKSFGTFRGLGAGLMLLFSLCAGGTFVSCENEHCDEPMYSSMGVSCLSEINPTEKYSLLGLSLLPIGADTIYAGLENGLFYLPLNPSASDTKFIWSMIPRGYENVGVSLDTVWQDGVAVDVKYCMDGKSVSLLKKERDLFLFSDSTMLYFYAGGFVRPMIDTLTISYDPIHEFVSGECGYRTIYELKNVAFSKGVGDLLIDNDRVTNKYKENHVNIYMSVY
ncbi:MAG: hypothetical protein J6Y37_07510 [Paludibacteraceae bacterium]|nr:hypothetical protein [Paludibacteraceae bacterium]